MLGGFLGVSWVNRGVGPPCISYTGCTLQTSVLRNKIFPHWVLHHKCLRKTRALDFSKCEHDTCEERPPRDAVHHRESVNFGRCDSHSMTWPTIERKEDASWKLKWKDKHCVWWSGRVGGDSGRRFRITALDPKLCWIAFTKSVFFQ